MSVDPMRPEYRSASRRAVSEVSRMFPHLRDELESEGEVALVEACLECDEFVGSPEAFVFVRSRQRLVDEARRWMRFHRVVPLGDHEPASGYDPPDWGARYEDAVRAAFRGCRGPDGRMATDYYLRADSNTCRSLARRHGVSKSKAARAVLEAEVVARGRLGG